MMLVDSSVWIDHLRHGDAALTAALEAGQVWMHSFVLGELACGNLRSRAERAQVLGLLQALPPMPVSTDKEVLFFIDQHELMGRGIGYIDVHLLASARLGVCNFGLETSASTPSPLNWAWHIPKPKRNTNSGHRKT
jgi:predicted nucleic acid-binding protein